MLPINENCTDRELISAISENNSDAFRILFNRYYKQLVHFALLHTNSIDISRDLVQDAFYKVWIVRSKLDSDKSIKAYLYRITTNSIINFYRSWNFKNFSIRETQSDYLHAKDAQTELKLDIETALNKLPIKLRTVIILSKFEGYKYDEIAGICQISVKAVEKRISKAFVLLKDYLK
jgi:RNA polymerase sigma-70 factor (ECF subfamily)